MKKKKKVIVITSFVIASLVVLATIFGYVDYKLAKNGKKPIFSIQRYSVESFEVEIAGEETDNKQYKQEQVHYSGLGYKIITCNYCEKSAMIYLAFADDQKYFHDELVCKNDKQTLTYNFTEHKLENINAQITIPAKEIKDVKAYEKENLEFNKISGCGSTFQKNTNSNGYVTYRISKYCEVNEMTVQDLKKEYGLNKEALSLAKKELLKKLKNDNPKIACE